MMRDGVVSKKYCLIIQVAAPASLGISLLGYQQEGLGWMLQQEQSEFQGGILADEMGMGKTIQAIALVLASMEYGFGGAVETVTPTVTDDSTSGSARDDRAKESAIQEELQASAEDSHAPPSVPDTSSKVNSTVASCEETEHIGIDEPQSSSQVEVQGGKRTDGNDSKVTRIITSSWDTADDDMDGSSKHQKAREGTNCIQAKDQGRHVPHSPKSSSVSERTEACGSTASKSLSSDAPDKPAGTSDTASPSSCAAKQEDVSNQRKARVISHGVASTDSLDAAGNGSSKSLDGPTLIVAPTSCLLQWWDEINRYTDPEQVSTFVYYNERDNVTAEQLLNYDIVLTTYPVIEYEYRRVVNTEKVECEYCQRKFLPRTLIVHQQFFCGPKAVRYFALCGGECSCWGKEGKCADLFFSLSLTHTCTHFYSHPHTLCVCKSWRLCI